MDFRSLRGSAAIILMPYLVLTTGCLDRELKPLNPCLVSGVADEVTSNRIDKVDLLFVVDNSGSMREEQQLLSAQFERLIQILTTGDKSPENGIEQDSDFPAAKDLHLGVVTTDMGVVDIPNVPTCTSDNGDDGILQTSGQSGFAAGLSCRSEYPRFLEFTQGLDDPIQTAQDFACIATVGTGGCGFEQQLEAPLKALWPSGDTRIQFIEPGGRNDGVGHGDRDNAGFLRDDPEQGLSLVAIIIVSDEEDCSFRDGSHLLPEDTPGIDPALAAEPINLRCFNHPENLYDPSRYIRGYKALRESSDELVVFGAIVGVPPDLVEPDDLDGVDFEASVEQADGSVRFPQAEEFYDRILADERMIETPDPALEGDGRQKLLPSCVRPNPNDPGGEPITEAFPPRRFIEVAKGFGPRGTVQSICQDDFGPALDRIIDIIGDVLSTVCLPRSLTRDADGLVGCEVVWELPTSRIAPDTPLSCDDLAYLVPPEPGRATQTADGGAICNVVQIPVTDPGPAWSPGTIQGWYYDDFSEVVAEGCSEHTPQRVAFTPGSEPPTGVVVKLECLNQVQNLVHAGENVRHDQPTIGTPCPGGEDECDIELTGGGLNRELLFCHPAAQVCMQGCESDADCPAAWACDDRPETLGITGDRAICVNPTCGA